MATFSQFAKSGKRDPFVELPRVLRTIDNLIARGELVALKITRKVPLNKRDFARLAERHRVGAELGRLADETLAELTEAK